MLRRQLTGYRRMHEVDGSGTKPLCATPLANEAVRRIFPVAALIETSQADAALTNTSSAERIRVHCLGAHSPRGAPPEEHVRVEQGSLHAPVRSSSPSK